MDIREKASQLRKGINKQVGVSGIEKYIGKRRLLLVSVMFIPAFFLTSYFIAFSLMVLTVAISLLVNRFGLNRFGLELATFSTVTMAYIFGPEKGALLGFVYIILQMFSGNTPGVYLVWVAPSYVAAGYITGAVNIDIATLGLYTSIALQSFFTFMTFLMSRGRLPKFIQYAIFNVTINMILFQTVAQPLLDITGT